MPAAGRTARGLERVPERPARPKGRPANGQPSRQRRRRKQFAMFSVGNGMDMPLFVFIMVLLAIGLVMLFSASYADSYYREGDSYFYIRRQAGFAAFGLVAMVMASLIDYHRYHKAALVLAGVTVVLLLMVVVFGRILQIESIAPSEGVAYRWLNLGVQFQPSEVAKFSLILLFAHMISLYADKMDTFRYGVLPFGAVLVLFALLIFLENHMSGTLIVLALGGIMMFVGGTRPRWLVLGIAVGIAALMAYMLLGGKDESGEGGVYQMGRVEIWLDPFNEDNDQATWQTRQSLYAIGSGGLFGVGLGQSRQKYMYLPKPQNDFIFAIVCEELGMVGALVIMLLFALLIWRGVYVSLHAKDRFGTMLGLGLTFQVGLQAVLNICVVTNTIPNTGISLPFFSAGGTSLVMLLGEMGILLNISRSANVERT
ncbi:FtsW/RodA/SpoVE family cell cycle protein [Acutalibacter caecimuris]|uniref:FtsW/RodA/SpoVE family cell cycle protein n=1 Tax=Acutalibacter caecimuris TaxID=3093657 RepID=UPI002AC97FC0|nr:putative peptidoglycan glycosyltransferase FtsW [Acutalibacter sp. M00118]